MPKVGSAALLVALLGAGLAGCGGDDGPATAPSPAPTSIAGLDSAAMRVVRVPFCDLVPAASIRTAVGGTPATATTWGNGDPVPGTAKADAAHELGCSWTGPSGTTARAWVFARPVTAAFAGTLVRAAGRERGCRAVAGPTFGTPTLTQTCVRAGGIRRVRHAGLFGDTWLTCEVFGRGWCCDFV
ncbi:MAG: hypothetical protein ACJ72D_12885, partial [Marmoricola sp.]